MKDLAVQHGVPVIATYQSNREGERKPSLGTLAYTDAIAQDADMVLGVVTQRRRDEPDRSGVFVLGAREVSLEGVVINNVPCRDFTEMGPIDNSAAAFRALTAEPEEEQKPKNTTPAREARSAIPRRAAPKQARLRSAR